MDLTFNIVLLNYVLKWVHNFCDLFRITIKVDCMRPDSLLKLVLGNKTNKLITEICKLDRVISLLRKEGLTRFRSGSC